MGTDPVVFGLSINVNDKSIVLELDNSIGQYPKLTSYLNAWNNTRKEYGIDYNSDTPLEYIEWKQSFPRYTDDALNSIKRFYTSHFNYILDNDKSIKKEHKTLKSSKDFRAAVSSLIENKIAIKKSYDVRFTYSRVPKAKTLPVLYIDTKDIESFSEDKEKAYVDFLLSLEDLKALKIDIDFYVTEILDKHYLCYNIDNPELNEELNKLF